MAKIRIIKKNNDCSMEYEVGDICEVTGTWYGGVHINGRSGIPVSLDKEEYMELNTEPEEPDSAENENTSSPEVKAEEPMVNETPAVEPIPPCLLYTSPSPRD